VALVQPAFRRIPKMSLDSISNIFGGGIPQIVLGENPQLEFRPAPASVGRLLEGETSFGEITIRHARA
jgi:hypothetical protein